MGVSRSLPHTSVCTSPTWLRKDHSGDTEVAGTVRYCHGLTIRTKSGNSCCCSDPVKWARGSLSPKCHEWGEAPLKVTPPDAELKTIDFRVLTHTFSTLGLRLLTHRFPTRIIRGSPDLFAFCLLPFAPSFVFVFQHVCPLSPSCLGLERKFPEKNKSRQIYMVWHTVTGGE
jgi:hypothetical protein